MYRQNVKIGRIFCVWTRKIDQFSIYTLFSLKSNSNTYFRLRCSSRYAAAANWRRAMNLSISSKQRFRMATSRSYPPSLSTELPSSLISSSASNQTKIIRVYINSIIKIPIKLHTILEFHSKTNHKKTIATLIPPIQHFPRTFCTQ